MHFQSSNRREFFVLIAMLCTLTLLLPGCNPTVDKQDEPVKAEAANQDTAAGSSESSTAPPTEMPASKETDGSNDGAAESAESSDSGAPHVAEVTLKKVSHEDYQQILKEQAGKVVLVDFWATWCLPCIQQFPHTLELAEKHAPEGLVVITFSCDKPDDEAKVLEFLNKKNSRVINLLTDSDYSTTSEQYDIRGGNPYYLLFDRQGNLRYRFSGVVREEDETEEIEKIDERVKELLAESP